MLRFISFTGMLIILSVNMLNFQFAHKSSEILCSLGTSHYLNGEYSNAIIAYEKVSSNLFSCIIFDVKL
jgi:hypothetical protein